LSARIRGELAVLGVALALCCACGPTAYGQDRAADLRSRFSRESDPVRKAKLMPELGDAQFREIESDLLAERLPDALTILQQYRDEAQSCEKVLDAKSVDAEQHPAGFKQLEFSLHESLRRLDDLLVTLTHDDQVPFEAARNDIDDMNRHLIHELFPRQPAPDAPEPKPKN
jgi:hypothetical protein